MTKQESKYNIKVLYNENNEKLCSTCNKYVDINLYHSNGKNKDGKYKLRSECKFCRKQTNRKNYLKRKEKANKTENFLELLHKHADNNEELLKVLSDENNCKLLINLIKLLDA